MPVQAFIHLAAPNPILISIPTSIAHYAPVPGMSAYGISKAGNLKMMDYIAAENPKLHVVNVRPGIVSTEMNGDSSKEGQDEGLLHSRALRLLERGLIKA